MACETEIASGVPIAISELVSATATLEISTAMAGAATDCSPRIATAADADGEPENRCASSPCRISARWRLASEYGFCASAHGVKPGAANAGTCAAAPVAPVGIADGDVAEAGGNVAEFAYR